MAHYSLLPQWEDVEIQRGSSSLQQYAGGNLHESITISRETRPDGTIVRHKVTELCNGETLVEENVEDSPREGLDPDECGNDSTTTGDGVHYGIRFLPATVVTRPYSRMLPFHRRALPRTEVRTSSSYDTKGDRRGNCGWIVSASIFILIVLLMLQLLLWYMMKSRRGFDEVLGSITHLRGSSAGS